VSSISTAFCRSSRLAVVESVGVRLLPILGSIRHQHKLLDVMKTWSVDTVYHAAYKHVPHG
jgi:FlaA1/EpsC-like NDP-sugar epimerase